jgi:hypothetical protein
MAAPSPVAQASASLCSGRSSDRCIFLICHPDQSAAFFCERVGSWQDSNSTRPVRCFDDPTDRRTLKPSSLASRKRPHQTNHKQHQNGSGQDYNNHGLTLQRIFYRHPSGQSSSLYFQRVTGRPLSSLWKQINTPVAHFPRHFPSSRTTSRSGTVAPKKQKPRDNPGVPRSCFT